MTDFNLARVVSDLTALAERHEYRMDLTANAPVTAEELAGLESYIGAPAPQSLTDLLRIHDGIAFRLIRKSDTYPYPVYQYEFVVFSVDEIISRTADMRETLSGFDLSSPDGKDRSERAYRCVDCAGLGDIDMRIVYCLDIERPNGEYGIVLADVDCMTWLTNLYDDDAPTTLADSFAEVFTRSIKHMLTYEIGFEYWLPVEKRLATYPLQSFWK